MGRTTIDEDYFEAAWETGEWEPDPIGDLREDEVQAEYTIDTPVGPVPVTREQALEAAKNSKRNALDVLRNTRGKRKREKVYEWLHEAENRIEEIESD